VCVLDPCLPAALAGVMLAVCGVLDALMGARGSILGLAGFVTLPSRETVCVWQFSGILTGSGEQG